MIKINRRQERWVGLDGKTGVAGGETVGGGGELVDDRSREMCRERSPFSSPLLQRNKCESGENKGAARREECGKYRSPHDVSAWKQNLKNSKWSKRGGLPLLARPVRITGEEDGLACVRGVWGHRGFGERTRDCTDRCRPSQLLPIGATIPASPRSAELSPLGRTHERASCLLAHFLPHFSPSHSLGCEHSFAASWWLFNPAQPLPSPRPLQRPPRALKPQAFALSIPHGGGCIVAWEQWFVKGARGTFYNHQPFPYLRLAENKRQKQLASNCARVPRGFLVREGEGWRGLEGQKYQSAPVGPRTAAIKKMQYESLGPQKRCPAASADRSVYIHPLRGRPPSHVDARELPRHAPRDIVRSWSVRSLPARDLLPGYSSASCKPNSTERRLKVKYAACSSSAHVRSIDLPQSYTTVKVTWSAVMNVFVYTELLPTIVTNLTGRVSLGAPVTIHAGRGSDFFLRLNSKVLTASQCGPRPRTNRRAARHDLGNRDVSECTGAASSHDLPAQNATTFRRVFLRRRRPLHSGPLAANMSPQEWHNSTLSLFGPLELSTTSALFHLEHELPALAVEEEQRSNEIQSKKKKKRRQICVFIVRTVRDNAITNRFRGFWRSVCSRKEQSAFCSFPPSGILNLLSRVKKAQVAPNKPAIARRFSAFEVNKRGTNKGDAAESIKHAIAAKRQALNLPVIMGACKTLSSATLIFHWWKVCRKVEYRALNGAAGNSREEGKKREYTEKPPPPANCNVRAFSRMQKCWVAPAWINTCPVVRTARYHHDPTRHSTAIEPYIIHLSGGISSSLQNNHFYFPTFEGPATTERLDCSPPAKVNRVQSPRRVTPGFSQVWIVPDDAASRQVFSEHIPFPPPFAFRRCSMRTSFHPHRLSRPRSTHALIKPARYNFLVNWLPPRMCFDYIRPTPSLTTFTSCCPPPPHPLHQNHTSTLRTSLQSSLPTVERVHSAIPTGPDSHLFDVVVVVVATVANSSSLEPRAGSSGSSERSNISAQRPRSITAFNKQSTHDEDGDNSFKRRLAETRLQIAERKNDQRLEIARFTVNNIYVPFAVDERSQSLQVFYISHNSVSEGIWAALTSEVLRAEEGEVRSRTLRTQFNSQRLRHLSVQLMAVAYKLGLNCSTACSHDNDTQASSVTLQGHTSSNEVMRRRWKTAYKSFVAFCLVSTLSGENRILIQHSVEERHSSVAVIYNTVLQKNKYRKQRAIHGDFC
ncbi:hypothetical protein PR048_018997 [Dryococelus australis]|uniref:Uncharacterized protein n=1 Tax=Dryococelus australis TaxID=614101 RepID=A0ABQ9H2A5_9NEOP|nr:hypothetical protein PR048_018997 [Dryococelus australis]